MALLCFVFCAARAPSAAAALECAHRLESGVGLVPGWVTGLGQCSSRNLEAYRPASTHFRSARLSTRCADHWEVRGTDGTREKLPSGTRVIRLEGNRVLYTAAGPSGSLLREGVLPEEAFTGRAGCTQRADIPSKDSFVAEARLSIELVRSLYPNSNPQFMGLLPQLERRLEKIQKMSKVDFEKFAADWQKSISAGNDSRVIRIERLQSMLSSSYNPTETSGKRLFDETLIVPISREWFESIPELRSFYQTQWLGSGYDIRIANGASGEGVVGGDGYLQMRELLEKTRQFVSQSADPRIRDSAEASWLRQKLPSSQDAGNKSGPKRLIFFSPPTWTADSVSEPWAEYIPVDQSMGGLGSDYLLSVLIHELNVNSANYLSNDTHSDPESTDLLLSCIAAHGVGALRQDAESIRLALGLNPQISVIYLQAMLSNVE